MMDWAKHATRKSKSKDTRRLALPITPELQKAIEFFRMQNSKYDFTDTAVVITFIEAGVRAYVANLNAKSDTE